MSNQFKNELKEKIGEVEYVLRPTMAALVEIEDKIGKPVLDLVTGLKFEDGQPVRVGLKVKEIAVIICEAAKAAGKEIDVHNLYLEIEKHGLGKFTNLAITLCVQAVTGTGEGKAEGAAKP